jgi:hypothetical protein
MVAVAHMFLGCFAHFAHFIGFGFHLGGIYNFPFRETGK